MNPFTHSRSSRDLMPERVALPGVDQEQVDRLREELDYVARTRRGFLLALIRKNGPVYGGTARWKRPKKRTSKHVRHLANVRARSAYLKEVA